MAVIVEGLSRVAVVSLRSWPVPLARLLSHGRLGGTGKLMILPVDQGFERDKALHFLSTVMKIYAGDLK